MNKDYIFDDEIDNDEYYVGDDLLRDAMEGMLEGLRLRLQDELKSPEEVKVFYHAGIRAVEGMRKDCSA